MRLVLGLSLTPSSAVWALVDTDDGGIVAHEVVEHDSLHEMARAAALSVQAFAEQSEHEIESIRLTWTDDAHQEGVRLRTKLRLLGFEQVETVSQEAANEGRNKTARYLAPHLTLAYGAARSDHDADRSGSVFDRFPVRLPKPVAVTSGAAAALLVVGGGLYAFGGSSTSEPSYTTSAEAAPAQSLPRSVPPPAAAPSRAAVPPVTAEPAEAAAPSPPPEPVAAWVPAPAVAQPETVAGPDVATGVELDSVELDAVEFDTSVPLAVPATVGVPHLSGTPAQAPTPARSATPAQAGTPAQTAVHGAKPLQALGPVPPAAVPAQGPAVSVPPFVVPSPLPPPLSNLLGALP